MSHPECSSGVTHFLESIRIEDGRPELSLMNFPNTFWVRSGKEERKDNGKGKYSFILFRNPTPMLLYLVVHRIGCQVDFTRPDNRPVFHMGLGE